MSFIYVTNLFDMPTHATSLGVGALVSIIQDEYQPDTPPGIDAARHHRVPVHDITQPMPAQVLATERHVADLIAFLDAWDADVPLLVHCYAGVSRSTATALVAHAMKTGEPVASARLLREQAPHAAPNRHLITLADKLLDLHGALLDAVDTMGPPDLGLLDGQLTTLPLRRD